MATVPDKSGNGTTVPDEHLDTPTQALLKQIIENTEPAE